MTLQKAKYDLKELPIANYELGHMTFNLLKQIHSFRKLGNSRNDRILTSHDLSFSFLLK